MFDSNQKATGTGYVQTVMLLSIGFIFIPLVLLLSIPFGYAPIVMATSCCGLCVALARVAWKKSSRLSIPSITVDRRDAK